MSDTQNEADELKNQANKLFEARKYPDAVETYTKAIDLSPNAILYSNRAFAHIKMENFGSAIIDAQKAIELDPKYVKGYYRLGAANLALGKYKEAVSFFRQVVRIVPNDKDARLKLDECEKTVKRMAFEKAIQAEHVSAFKALDVESIAIESSYEGLHMPTPISLDFVKQLIQAFKDQKKLHKKYVASILAQIHAQFLALPTLIDIEVPEGHHFTVCGDVHGQFYDLCNIFELNGLPSETNPYLFNGDFVDRGSFSIEVILTLFSFKLLYPTHMHLARGNHESKSMNKMYGFEGEVKAKYTETIFDLFSEVFLLIAIGTFTQQESFGSTRWAI